MSRIVMGRASFSLGSSPYFTWPGRSQSCRRVDDGATLVVLGTLPLPYCSHSELFRERIFLFLERVGRGEEAAVRVKWRRSFEL